jgi:hypothetical protein
VCQDRLAATDPLKKCLSEHFDEINLLMTEKAKGLSELRRTDP